MSFILRNRSRLAVQGHTDQNCNYPVTATLGD